MPQSFFIRLGAFPCPQAWDWSENLIRLLLRSTLGAFRKSPNRDLYGLVPTFQLSFSFPATSPFAFHSLAAPKHREFLVDMSLFTPLGLCTCFYLCLEPVFLLSLPICRLLITIQSPATLPSSKKPVPLDLYALPLHSLGIWYTFPSLPENTPFLCLSLLRECTRLLQAGRLVYPALAQVWHDE